jgi:hypothetical protein
MSVRVAIVLALTAGVLAGCGSSGDGSAGLSKAAICAQALGVLTVSEVGDDVQRRAQEAKDAADTLSRLATQTQDRSLSQALSAAASQAGEVTRERLSGNALRDWATREQERFSALRNACS